MVKIHPAARLTTKRFLLQILNAIDGHRSPASELIRAAEVMQISANSVRVTLARLKAAGLVEDEPGAVYALSREALRVQRYAAGWQRLESRVAGWDGSWLVIATGALPRGDRKALAARRRAMSLFGFETLDRCLRLRPNNLALSLDELRHELFDLGLDEEAVIGELRGLGARDDARARGLWDGETIDRQHRTTRRELESSLEQLPRMSREEAARQTFLLGNQAIHQLVLDPLLPEPLVDPEARHRLVQVMARYDIAGRQAWRQIIGEGAVGRTQAMEPQLAVH